MADNNMVKVGLWVRLEAKPGKEKDVENFLQAGLSIVQQEVGTTSWYAVKLGPSTFGIFDTFQDDAGRQAHLSGRVAAALREKGAELFATSPTIEKFNVLAVKLPR
jgi:quinol monooxygenase YgiN